MENQEIRIQIIFRTDTKYGTFQDALWFSKEDYEKATQEDIDVMKQERVDNWIKVMTTSVSEPTKEEQLAQVQSQIDFFTARLQDTINQKSIITAV